MEDGRVKDLDATLDHIHNSIQPAMTVMNHGTCQTTLQPHVASSTV